MTKIMRQLSNICKEIETPSVYQELSEAIENLNSPYIRIAILGGLNTGKTTLLNRILKDLVTLPVSSVSTDNDRYIFPDENNFYLKDGKKNAFEKGDKIESAKDSITEIHVVSEWLDEHNISLSELHNVSVEEKFKDAQIAAAFSSFDMCIYILDAMMPLTKSDVAILNQLDRFEIPTLVSVSKYKNLLPEDKEDVFKFLETKLKKYSNLTYLGIKSNDSENELAITVKNFIENALQKNSTSTQRDEFKRLFILDSIEKCERLCQSQIDENQLKMKKIKENTQEKLDKVKALQTEWMRLETELSEKRQNTTDKIREKLKKKENDMLRRLTQDVETYDDLKKYWDKQLSYRIDDMLRAETEVIRKTINLDIINNLQWLQNETTRIFKKNASAIPAISFSIEEQEIEMDELQITDSKNIKYATRVGSIPIAFGASLIIGTVGIGALVMAASFLGSEIIVRKKTHEARQKILNILPTILEKARLEFTSRISDSLKESYEEVITNLKTAHKQWEEKRIEEIKEEELIANRNLINPKWAQYKKELEQLQSNYNTNIT